MPNYLLFLLRYGFYILFVSGLSGPSLADNQPENNISNEALLPLGIADELDSQQKRLDAIKQAVSAANSDAKLNALNEGAQSLSDEANGLLILLNKRSSQIETQLSVLGPAPEKESDTETAEVADKRSQLIDEKKRLDGWLVQVNTIESQTDNLSEQIANLRRDLLKTQLALNSGSILNPSFWAPLINVNKVDLQRFQTLKGKTASTLTLTWSEGRWQGTLLLLALAFGVATVGYRLFDRGLGWVGTQIIPAGHLRRSFLAAATVLSTVIIGGCTAALLSEALFRAASLTDDIRNIADNVVRLAIFCAFIAGLGNAFLSIKRPTWRLPDIADSVARTMVHYPVIIAIEVFILGTIAMVIEAIGIGVYATVAAKALTSLLLALTACFITLCGSKVRRDIIANGDKPEARSTLAGFIHLAVLLTAIVILAALCSGYIALAQFFTYELLWSAMVLSCFYLLINLLLDSSETLFSPDYASGKRIKMSFGLEDRHLALANSLVSALGRVILILLTITALLNGTFASTTPLELLHNATELWGGKWLQALDIVPAKILNAVLLIAVSLYILRAARRWLESDFLPKTAMNSGIQASLVTLLTNVGYVLVIFMALSAFGLEWSNLAWIVSALSVGIGFGLQEIVKNFISGLILLTERPVKVGDLVSISGIEGDIRRINVRATEIQLSDRSTVIVPNSQFISQNVRNVTMEDALGVVSIELKLALDIDPERVRDLLLEVFRQYDAILDTPQPSVTFKTIDPAGVVLGVTGYVKSPRMVNGAKSDLLFDALKRLHESHTKLADSSIVRFHRDNADSADLV